MTEKDLAEEIEASERRKSDRKKLIVDVKFEEGETTGIANTRDIGIGGLYMTTNTQLETGTPIYMTMNIGERNISIGGTVVYTDPGYGVGIRFQNLKPDDETFLKQELQLE